MFHSVSLFRGGRMPVLALALAVALSGCESKQDKAIDQAKKEAAKTGQPQQVVSVAKDGTTTTTIVQPPAPGQTAQATTTSTAPPPQGGPAPAPSEPKVSPVAQEAPKPVSVTIPAGTNLAIRVDQRISVKTNHAGDTFTGEVVEPISDSRWKYAGAEGRSGRRCRRGFEEARALQGSIGAGPAPDFDDAEWNRVQTEDC